MGKKFWRYEARKGTNSRYKEGDFLLENVSLPLGRFRSVALDTASLLDANYHYYYYGRVRDTALPMNMKLRIENSKSRCKCSDVFAFVH